MAATRPRFWGLLPSPEGRSGEVLCLWSTGEERLGAEQSDGKGQAPAMPGGGELRAPWVPTARSRVAQSLAAGHRPSTALARPGASPVAVPDLRGASPVAVPGLPGKPSSRSQRRRLPSTLVRVRTGLLQALSGATLAECFFMASPSPAAAPRRPAPTSWRRRSPPRRRSPLRLPARRPLPQHRAAGAGARPPARCRSGLLQTRRHRHGPPRPPPGLPGPPPGSGRGRRPDAAARGAAQPPDGAGPAVRLRRRSRAAGTVMRLRTPLPLRRCARAPRSERRSRHGRGCWCWAAAPHGKGSWLITLCLVLLAPSEGKGEFTLSEPIHYLLSIIPPLFSFKSSHYSESIFIRAFSNFCHPRHSLSVPAISFWRETKTRPSSQDEILHGFTNSTPIPAVTCSTALLTQFNNFFLRHRMKYVHIHTH